MVVIFEEVLDEHSLVRRLVEAVYMISAILFIFSLAGLKKANSSRRGVFFGVCGMALAILATMCLPEFHEQFIWFVIALIPGAVIGFLMALLVNMEQLPQMVACLHSFVGIAATLIGFSSFFLHQDAEPQVLRDIETYLGIFIGVITFAGSVIAFMKLAGLGGSTFEGPLMLPGILRHLLNGTAGVAVVTCGIVFCFYQYAWCLYANAGLGIFLGRIHFYS